MTSSPFLDCLVPSSQWSECSHGVGTNAPDKIPDEAITASSSIGAWSLPSYARLDKLGLAWYAATETVAEFLQYDLGEMRLITAMRAQGADTTSGTHGCIGGGLTSMACPYNVMMKFTVKYSVTTYTPSMLAKSNQSAHL